MRNIKAVRKPIELPSSFLLIHIYIYIQVIVYLLIYSSPFYSFFFHCSLFLFSREARVGGQGSGNRTELTATFPWKSYGTCFKLLPLWVHCPRSLHVGVGTATAAPSTPQTGWESPGLVQKPR